jgi:hypothetical protein
MVYDGDRVSEMEDIVPDAANLLKLARDEFSVLAKNPLE